MSHISIPETSFLYRDKDNAKSVQALFLIFYWQGRHIEYVTSLQLILLRIQYD